MSAGFEYKCSHCDYSEVISPNKYYVRDDRENIYICSDEDVEFIYSILESCEKWKGLNTPAEQKLFMEQHTGYGSDFLCLACKEEWLHTGELKPDECPSCTSKKIKDKWYLNETTCPHCQKGTVVRAMEPDWVS